MQEVICSSLWLHGLNSASQGATSTPKCYLSLNIIP